MVNWPNNKKAQQEGPQAATKLYTAHIQWKKQKMKVDSAIQI